MAVGEGGDPSLCLIWSLCLGDPIFGVLGGVGVGVTSSALCVGGGGDRVVTPPSPQRVYPPPPIPKSHTYTTIGDGGGDPTLCRCLSRCFFPILLLELFGAGGVSSSALHGGRGGVMRIVAPPPPSTT